MAPPWQSAEDLPRFREPGKTAELVRGVLVVRYLVARRAPVLRRRPVVCGVAYGLLLYVVMNDVSFTGSP